MSQSTATARVLTTRPIARPSVRERPVQPRLRVVAPVRRRSATGLAMLCVALLGGGLLVLLLLNISIGKGAYALTELQAQQHQLANDRQALAEQVDLVSAPDQLAAAARKLGMVPQPGPAFIRLPNGTVEGKPTKAEAPLKPVHKQSQTKPGQTVAGAATTGAKKTTDSSTTTDANKVGTTKKTALSTVDESKR